MSLLFRPQRVTLADAMAEVREFDGTSEGLQALLGRQQLKSVEKYGGFDSRIGWDTYIVMVEHPDPRYPQGSVAGFTNGPLQDKP